MNMNYGEETPPPRVSWDTFEETVARWRRERWGCPGDDALVTYFEGLGPRWPRLRVWWHVRRCALCRADLATLHTAFAADATDATASTPLGQGGLGLPRRGWHPAWTPVLAVGLVLSLTLHAYQMLAPASRPDRELTQQSRGGEEGAGVEPTLYGLVQQARQYEREGNTAQAIASYQAALDQVAFPLNNLAWLYYQQGDASTGLPLARLAVQLRPEEAEYLDTLAVLLCTVGEQGAALHTMAKAAALRPEQFREKLARFQQGVCQ